MAKNKHKNPHHSVPPTMTRSEPTPEQRLQLDAVAGQVADLLTAHGPVSSDISSEPAGATLAESLKRVEDLLGKARALFEKGRSMELANKTEADRLAALKRDQEDTLKQKRKSVDDEIAALRKSLDHQEIETLTRIDAVAKREIEVAAREASLAEQGARLAEREVNAEQGFVAEKTRILKSIEGDVHRLREERDRLEAELGARHEKAEEELRARAAARAARWAEEDAARISRDAESRRQLDDELARERHQGLEDLRRTLQAEREKAEATWRLEVERRASALEAREAGLDAREAELASRLRAQRAAELDLQTARDLHEEDRAALERRVERLVNVHTERLRSDADGLRRQLEDARSDRDAYWASLEARRELDRRFGGRAPEDILSALTAAERERDLLAQQLQDRPDARVAERLADLERERSAWLDEQALLRADLARQRGELQKRRESAIELEGLRREKELLDHTNKLLKVATDELKTRVDELTKQDDHRNPMTALTTLDGKEELQNEVRTTTPLGRATSTLKEFAIDLRHRIAVGVEGRTLYYADRDVRAFLGGLAMTRLMLLQGISGTGKTSLPQAFASAVGGDIEIVEVQAGWRDRQDLIGYYNAFHRHYYATNFLKALYRAGTPAYRDRLVVIVLDEINLSRPEQFFADFLSALEQPMSKRRLTLVSDEVPNAPKLMKGGKDLPIPPNVWFIGTANHDESTAEFADKIYDRAHVMEMPRKTEDAHFAIEEKGARSPISYGELENAFEAAARNQAPAVKSAVNWLRNAAFAEDLQHRFRVGWGNRLEQQLARYLPVIVESGGTVGEAMDHLLVTKVFRKLKDRHDVRAAALEDLRLQLESTWEDLDRGSLPERSFALIDREIATKKGEDLA